MYAVHEPMTECEVRVAERPGDAWRRAVAPRRPAAQAPAHSRRGRPRQGALRPLPPRPAQRVVGALAFGERTPVFRIDARRSAGTRGTCGCRAAAAVVRHRRCEANGTLGRGRRPCRPIRWRIALPVSRPSPHKDPRAPQNLSPIGGLERTAPAPVGDAQVWYRALRVASSPRIVSLPDLSTDFCSAQQIGKNDRRTPIERPAVSDQTASCPAHPSNR